MTKKNKPQSFEAARSAGFRRLMQNNEGKQFGSGTNKKRKGTKQVTPKNTKSKGYC